MSYRLTLQWLSSSKSRVQIVPPFDVILAASPAQINDSFITPAGEVDQSLIEVFDFDAEAENLLRRGYKGSERVRILIAARDAAAALALARAFGFEGHSAKRCARQIYLCEQPFDFWQQCVRFFEGKKFHCVLIIGKLIARKIGCVGQLNQEAYRKANSGRRVESLFSCLRDLQRVPYRNPLGCAAFCQWR